MALDWEGLCPAIDVRMINHPLATFSSPFQKRKLSIVVLERFNQLSKFVWFRHRTMPAGHCPRILFGEAVQLGRWCEGPSASEHSLSALGSLAQMSAKYLEALDDQGETADPCTQQN